MESLLLPNKRYQFLINSTHSFQVMASIWENVVHSIAGMCSHSDLIIHILNQLSHFAIMHNSQASQELKTMSQTHIRVTLFVLKITFITT